MTAQDLIDAAELHRLNGQLWMALPIWEQVAKEFPDSAESAYAKVQIKKHAHEKRGVIVQAWRGQRPLGEIFWVYYVMLQGGLIALAWFISMLASSKIQAFVYLTFSLTIFVLGFPYLIWVYFSLWRCSANSSAGLRFVTRAFVVLVVWLPLGFLAYSLIFSAPRG